MSCCYEQMHARRALTQEESERREQAQRHVLKLSREGQVDKVRQILDERHI